MGRFRLMMGNPLPFNCLSSQPPLLTSVMVFFFFAVSLHPDDHGTVQSQPQELHFHGEELRESLGK